MVSSESERDYSIWDRLGKQRKHITGAWRLGVRGNGNQSIAKKDGQLEMFSASKLIMMLGPR